MNGRLSIASALVVFVLLVGLGAYFAQRGADGSAATSPGGSANAGTSVPTEISWQPTLDAALAEAKKSGKPIMVDFYATWCQPCKMLDEQTYSDPAVIQEAEKFVSAKVDIDVYPEISNKYRITSIPTIGFMSPDGTPLTGIMGFVGPEDMVEQMKNAHQLSKDKKGVAESG